MAQENTVFRLKSYYNNQYAPEARKRSVTFNLSWTGIASSNFVFCLTIRCFPKCRTYSNCTADIWIKFQNCCASSNLNSFTSMEQVPNWFYRFTDFLTQHSLYFHFSQFCMPQWKMRIHRKKDIATNSLSYHNWLDSQEDTNISGLETKVSVKCQKVVTSPRVISDGQRPKTCLWDFLSSYYLKWTLEKIMGNTNWTFSHNANHIIQSYCYLPVSCRSLLDRRGYPGSCKLQI